MELMTEIQVMTTLTPLTANQTNEKLLKDLLMVLNMFDFILLIASIVLI
jgi:hypothetical protein